MSCGVGHRCGSDPTLLWLCHRPVATAPIGPLAWEPPYAMALKWQKTKYKKKKKKKSGFNFAVYQCEKEVSSFPMNTPGPFWLAPSPSPLWLMAPHSATHCFPALRWHTQAVLPKSYRHSLFLMLCFASLTRKKASWGQRPNVSLLCCIPNSQNHTWHINKYWVIE